MIKDTTLDQHRHSELLYKAKKATAERANRPTKLKTCTFHTTTEWRDGHIDHICLYVKNKVDCDGKSVSDMMRCPLWGKLVHLA